MQRGILSAVCALVIGVYAYMAQSEVLGTAAGARYNLLVQGFRAGQLSLEKVAPPGLGQLADAYDPIANAPYRAASYGTYDLSYYKGKLYLYWGVTPALLLFWPYVALTGHYLSQDAALVIFCAVGFLVSVGLLCALWRRYFAEVSVGVVAAGALALGLATGVPVMLPRADAPQLAISCGYMLTMLALAAIWCALRKPGQRWRWLAAASAAYGLAVSARPSLLFGAVILLVPVAKVWRERRQVLALLLAAVGPITVIGLGVMLYNFLRFDSPFEFGLRYQLCANRWITQRFFSLRYLWFNFVVYFLEPARWSGHFPLVNESPAPPLPAGHAPVETSFGVLTNIPLVWLALAVPLAWRNQSAEARSFLRWLVATAALYFGICALTLGFYYYVAIRFEVDFLPALVLLAVVGILGLERALADRPFWRRGARWCWGLLLGFSVAFNLLAGVEQSARAHNNLGAALEQAGQLQNAIGQYKEALRLDPDFAEAHYNLGMALEGTGPQAISHFERALRIKPDFAEAQFNLGVALQRAGQRQQAIEHYEQAVRLKPDFADAHNNLATAFEQVGQLDKAIGQYEQALRLKLDSAEAHYNLGMALEGAGERQRAIEHYEQALRIKPDLVEAQTSLARARAAQ